VVLIMEDSFPHPHCLGNWLVTGIELARSVAWNAPSVPGPDSLVSVLGLRLRVRWGWKLWTMWQ
jgi:hypothetical protein